MTDKDEDWKCSWEATETAQDRDSAALPLWRKIQWLENVHRMAVALEEQARRLRASASTGPTGPGGTDGQSR
jgi:hypothetical protein